MRSSPMWKISLVICTLMVALVIGYNTLLVHNASKQFRKNSREHARVLAAAVELNIRNAYLFSEGLELILANFLKNSARFISYLDQIVPFSEEELSSLAVESGLAGITIYSKERLAMVSGPENWGPGLDCDSPAGVTYLPDLHLYSFVYPTKPEDGCVVVGFHADDLEKVQANLSVERLLSRVNELPSILSARLLDGTENGPAYENQMAELIVSGGKYFTEARLPIDEQVLLVTQDGSHFAERLKRLRTVFEVFVFILVFFGALSTWWLYHAERRRLREAREYEKEMARQREEAVLGRAAGTIAHEIRNPLNAINMGLQRLQLETEGLEPEHLDLLVSMRQAVARSNGIITNLQQYVRSFEVTREQVELLPLIRSVLNLYGAACKAQGVEVVLEADAEYTVPGDTGLLGQLFENVIKNGVEAQPHGGYCRITVGGNDSLCRVRLESGGFLLSGEESKQLFEPYFTSKVQGTGLGLAISRKIVEAHGGSIEAEPDIDRKSLVLLIELPRK